MGVSEVAWIGKKTDLSYLQVFGCDAYVMTNPADRSKLDPKSKKHNFIVYGGEESMYCFWDYNVHKIVQSHDLFD